MRYTVGGMANSCGAPVGEGIVITMGEVIAGAYDDPVVGEIGAVSRVIYYKVVGGADAKSRSPADKAGGDNWHNDPVYDAGV